MPTRPERIQARLEERLTEFPVATPFAHPPDSTEMIRINRLELQLGNLEHVVYGLRQDLVTQSKNLKPFKTTRPPVAAVRSQTA